MPSFKYEALSEDGKTVTGSIEEDSAYRAATVLREQGLHVSSVTEEGKRPGFFRGKRALSAEDLVLLNEQLLTITESELPLAPALKAMAKDIGSGRLQAVLKDVQVRLEAGASLEEALSAHPESFSPVYLSILRAGEQTGNLAGVLSQLSAYSRRLTEIKSRLQEAVAYPVFVLVFAVVFVALAFTIIVPTFADMFLDFGGTLPWPTRICISISRVLTGMDAQAGMVVLGVVVLALLVVIRIAGSDSAVRYAFDSFKIRVPLLGPLYAVALVERFSRTLGLLLSSHASAPDSLNLAAEATGNAAFRLAGLNAALLVANGEKISDALAATKLFRHTVCWMLRQGEERGAVDVALLRLADSCEREAARRENLLLSLMAPFAIITVGMLVAFVVIAMFMPILQLSSLVGA